MKNLLPFLCVLLGIPAHATEKPIKVPVDPGANYVIQKNEPNRLRDSGVLLRA